MPLGSLEFRNDLLEEVRPHGISGIRKGLMHEGRARGVLAEETREAPEGHVLVVAGDSDVKEHLAGGRGRGACQGRGAGRGS